MSMAAVGLELRVEERGWCDRERKEEGAGLDESGGVSRSKKVNSSKVLTREKERDPGRHVPRSRRVEALWGVQLVTQEMIQGCVTQASNVMLCNSP